MGNAPRRRSIKRTHRPNPSRPYFPSKKATANRTTGFLIQLSNSGKSDWVNDNITRVKDFAQRNFVDF
ncbi:hypothetical protein [Marinomonas sp.]|uniref:hypothetical protein n=1 Tax=Marinomonas sp. TaxID=1904862 RepID=UPI003BAAC7AE